MVKTLHCHSDAFFSHVIVFYLCVLRNTGWNLSGSNNGIIVFKWMIWRKKKIQASEKLKKRTHHRQYQLKKNGKYRDRYVYFPLVLFRFVWCARFAHFLLYSMRLSYYAKEWSITYNDKLLIFHKFIVVYTDCYCVGCGCMTPFSLQLMDFHAWMCANISVLF